MKCKSDHQTGNHEQINHTIIMNHKGKYHKEAVVCRVVFVV